VVATLAESPANVFKEALMNRFLNIISALHRAGSNDHGQRWPTQPRSWQAIRAQYLKRELKQLKHQIRFILQVWGEYQAREIVLCANLKRGDQRASLIFQELLKEGRL
jgi:hypothetical protein